MQNQLTLTRSELQIIGYEVARKQPGLAKQIIAEKQSEISGCKDLSLINSLTESYQVPTRNKLLFAGVMLRLFHPFVFEGTPLLFTPKRGFVKAIATALSMDTGNASKLVRSAVLQVNVYEDFRASILNIVSTLNIPGYGEESKA